MIRGIRIIAGLLLWGAAITSLWWSVDRHLVAGGGIRSTLGPSLWSYATGERSNIRLSGDEPLTLRIGDPVFLVAGPGDVRQIGEVRQVGRSADGEPLAFARTREAEMLLYPDAPALPAGASLAYYETPDSMGWVLETMLPPEKRKQIAGEIAAAIEEHSDEIIAELKPIVADSLRDALVVLEGELAASLQRHRPELQAIGSRYQRELVDEELVPLVKEVIWPIVRARAEPTANEIGLEVWARVSIWRFTWRYLYDVSPLPERRRLEREWDRFLRDEAFPILESHTDDFVKIVQQSLAEVARNKAVQAAARESMTKILSDPELQKVVWSILREVIVDNPKLHATLEAHWTGPRAKAAFALASERMEPTVQRIGRLMFGTREGGITPEFARVLRHRILRKDRRWLVVVLPAEGESVRGGRPEVLPVRRGEVPGDDPFEERSRLAPRVESARGASKPPLASPESGRVR